MADLFEEPKETIKRITSAERVDATILGVTLYFADGHSVVLDVAVVDAVRLLMYKVEQKALDDLRAEARRTY